MSFFLGTLFFVVGPPKVGQLGGVALGNKLLGRCCEGDGLGLLEEEELLDRFNARWTWGDR